MNLAKGGDPHFTFYFVEIIHFVEMQLTCCLHLQTGWKSFYLNFDTVIKGSLEAATRDVLYKRCRCS